MNDTLHAEQTLCTDKTTVFFAFDDRCVPWTRGVHLTMHRPVKHAENPIVRRGDGDAPDAHGAQFCSVLRMGDRWRMWYTACSTDGSFRVAVAESDDGVHWTKPNLRLAEFNGHRDNNLVDAPAGLVTVSVLYDPDAPADRRYVMVGEDLRDWHGWGLDVPSITRIDASPDGLHWRTVKDRSIISQAMEVITIYKFDGRYHIGGHQITPMLRLPMQKHELGGWLGPRTFVVYRSPYLDRWPRENSKAFFLPMRSSSPYRTGWDREEVHLGAGVTPYGNVCLGVYGQWHHPINEGEPVYDASAVSVDLGLIVSNDGLHFREPAPGFHFVERDQELAWDRDYLDNTTQDNLMLWQGSLVHTDQETFVYYAASTPVGNVAEACCNIGLATMPRDRFGSLSLVPGANDGQFVTCPLQLDTPSRLFVNADVPGGSELRLALLDGEGLGELPGYALADCHPVRSGLDASVTWNGGAELPAGRRFQVRADMRGDTRVYALYVR